MSAEGGARRLSGGPSAREVRGNHDNPGSGHHHQGTVTLIEISGEQVSWDLPIITTGRKGPGAKAIKHIRQCEQLLDLCMRAVNH